MRISTRLLLIIATCLVPTIGLQVAVGWSQWAERKAQLGDMAEHQARLLAGNLAGIAEGARILLGAAAEFRQVRIHGEECDARLTSLRRRAQGFAFLALVRSGEIICASDPALIGPGGDAAWIADAQTATGFTTGRFARSALHPGGFLPFYLPLAEEETGTLVAGLDLGWLEQVLHGLKRGASPFLESGVLTVADADGVILARDARHAEFVGKQFPPAAMSLVHAAAPGILRLKSIDGTERLVGYTPPTLENDRLSAVVGLQELTLMRDIERALLRSGVLIAVVSLIVFGLTMLVAQRSVARPTQALVAVAKRWREGDLAARAPTSGQGSEFSQIAAAYNDMAAALQRREEEMRGHADALEARVAERTRALQQANERLQVEIAERQNTQAALLQAQKMQAVGQLAGGIAHDFNNILQAVIGGASLIRRRTGDPAAVERLAGMVEDAVRRGQSITRRLLAFARREELRADTLDLSELLRGLQEVLAATLGAAMRVELAVAPELPPVHADRGQLETVLVNLATNARDAMPSGGTVTFSARVEDAPGDGATHDLPPGHYVHLAVVDTGEGMRPEVLARAAEPFFTTKPLGQGTGLGLAMARSFAEGSGGAFDVTSEQGRGTCVSLWLPVAGQQPVARPAAPSERDMARPEMRGPRLRLLLVDDEAMVRQVLAAELAEEGFAVAEAGDGQVALQVLDRGESFDLLVSDLAMPGLDGLALIREAQRRRPGLPAILLTGFAGDTATLSLGSAMGAAFTLVRKPVSGAQLADQARALLEAVEERAAAMP